MRRTLALLMLLPLITYSVPTQRRVAQRDLAASVLLHIKIITTNARGQTERGFIGCSGTYISPYTIITAAHCFEEGANGIWARGPYNVVGYPVHLVYWDKKADLAICDAPFGHPYVKIGGIPDWGDKVMNIGSPYDFEFVQSEGKVGPVDYQPGKPFTSEYLITTAMANPGSSGGGAFNTRGELVGVNTMVVGMFGWSGITMAVNTTSIELFLGKALRYYRHYGSQR